MLRSRTWIVTLLSLALAAPARAEDLATMMTYVPKDANALMIVGLKDLLGSAVGQRENWRAKAAQGALMGILPLPDLTDTVVVSSKLMPGTLQHRWEVVLISTTKPYDFTEIAQAEKAEIQTIGSTSVCFTSRNTVIVSLSKTLIGVYSPAQRQDVARWLRTRENREGKADYSPVLDEAVQAIRNGAKLALSLDVDESLETNRVRQFLQNQPAVKEHKADPDALAKVYARMVGLHFRVHASLDVQGTVWAQFAVPVDAYAAVMPSLLLSTLEGVGVNMEEFHKGKSQVLEKAVKIEATLTSEGLKSVASIMQPNTVAPPVAKKPAAAPAPAPDPAAVVAERLFRQVVAIANEAQSSGDRTSNVYRASIIYDHAANRIEKLPLATTDPAVQEFGVEVVKGLREIANVFRAAATDIMVLENQIVSKVSVTPTNPNLGFSNPWGINIFNPLITIPQYNIDTNQPQIVARQQTVLENANKQRSELWKQLQQRSNAVRKVLGDKYGIRFAP
jgi:hypothetical protein